MLFPLTFYLALFTPNSPLSIFLCSGHDLSFFYFATLSMCENLIYLFRFSSPQRGEETFFYKLTTEDFKEFLGGITGKGDIG